MDKFTSQKQAANEFVDLVIGALGTDGAVHCETAIASVARLAGSLLLRSFDLPLDVHQPGTVLLSAEADEHGSVLMSLLAGQVGHFGIPLNPDRLGGEAQMRGEAPMLSVVGSLSLLQDDAFLVATNNGLSLREASHSAAMSTAFIVKECAPNIGAEVAFNVATFGLIEGCKTVPPPIAVKSKATVMKKPWYRLWSNR